MAFSEVDEFIGSPEQSHKMQPASPFKHNCTCFQFSPICAFPLCFFPDSLDPFLLVSYPSMRIPYKFLLFSNRASIKRMFAVILCLQRYASQCKVTMPSSLQLNHKQRKPGARSLHPLNFLHRLPDVLHTYCCLSLWCIFFCCCDESCVNAMMGFLFHFVGFQLIE